MSNTITLTPEVISAYKTILTNPHEHGMTFRPLAECFSKSEVVTASHTLFDQYVSYINKPLPKLIFYIVMQELYQDCIGKDEKGLLGYFLKFIQP